MYRYKRQFCVFGGLLILLAAALLYGANNITRGNTEYLVGAKVITFTATLDSANRDTSNAFSLAEYAGRNWSDNTYTVNAYSIYPDTLEVDTTSLMSAPTFAFDSYLVYPDTFRSDSTYAVLRDTVNQTVTLTNGGHPYIFKVKSILRDTTNQTVTLANTGYPFRYSLGFSTTGDSFNVTTYFYGSMTGTAASWTYIDSIATVAGTSDTTIYGTIDFDNQKWPYYQMQQVDAAGLANDTTATVTTKLFCIE